MAIAKVSFLKLQRLYKQHGPEFAGYLQAEYGDLMVVRAPLLPPLVIALHPEHVYATLSRQEPMLEKPALMLRPLQASFGNGLFSSQGSAWLKQRKRMQPAFRHDLIGRYAARMVDHAEAMLATWLDGQTISIGAAMHELTLTIVLDALFSVKHDGEETAVIQQAIRDLGQGLGALSRSNALFLAPAWLPLPALRQKRRGERALSHSVQQLIAAREGLGEAASPPDLLTTLLFSQDTETGGRMSNQQLQDELITLYIAGHDTTAILLSWAWVLLAQHPAVTATLREELATVLNGRSPSTTDLPQLPYTQAIIKEVLRLYPPAWFLFRQAVPEFRLSGTPIPLGSMIFLMPYTTHRDGRFFAEPHAFQPERWLDGLDKQLPKGAYFPFGYGPRTCIGNGFAMMEGQLLLATIAQRFTMEQLSQAKMGHTATLGFAQPVQVRLSAR